MTSINPKTSILMQLIGTSFVNKVVPSYINQSEVGKLASKKIKAKSPPSNSKTWSQVFIQKEICTRNSEMLLSVYGAWSQDLSILHVKLKTSNHLAGFWNSNQSLLLIKSHSKSKQVFNTITSTCHASKNCPQKLLYFTYAK